MEDKNIDNINKEKKFSLKEKIDPSNLQKIKWIKVFLNKIKTDFLYLLSIIIIVLFLLVTSVLKVKDSDGYLSKNKDNESTNVVLKEELDITPYVGIYSYDVKLEESISLSNSCKLNSFKYVYEIEKDKTITKYLKGNCFGNIKIWDGTLSYVNNEGARFIGTSDYSFLFANKTMKELDGNTYKKDSSISSISENNKLKDSEVYFYNNKFILLTNDDLYLISDMIEQRVSDNYKNNGGDLEKRFYKVDGELKFNFIVFENGENVNYYNEVLEDGPLYKIYSIEYSDQEHILLGAKELISRNKLNSFSFYEDDLKMLNE